MGVYVVKAGDTLDRIALRFGSTRKDLLRQNPQITDPDRIFVGQEIKVRGATPPASPPRVRDYVVRKGDTLGKVAKTFGVTVAAVLRANPSITDPNVIRVGQVLVIPGRSPSPKVTPVPKVDGEPRWLTFAKRELGTKEIVGRSHTARIIEYHATTSLRATTDEVPWCSSFVNWCVERSGLRGTRSARARDWLNWGVPLRQPRLGAIAVFSRDGGGHVGFYVGETERDVRVLGGNQSNAVTQSGYARSRLLGYRWSP